MGANIFNELVPGRDPKRLLGIVNDLEIYLTRYFHLTFAPIKHHRISDG